MQHRVVITGAPGSGKSKCLQYLQDQAGFKHFAFFEEMARQLLEENPGYREDWPAFHVAIYERQREREREVGERSFVTDRGTPDAFAFHPETMTDVDTDLETEYRRYDLVIHLQSTAAMGEEHYETDDVRTETAAEAMEIEEALKRVWQDHPGYHFVTVSGDFEEKCRAVAGIIEQHIRKRELAE